MYKVFLFSALIFLMFSCQSLQQHSSIKNQPVIGGQCEGCESFDVGKPTFINNTDTSALWEAGEKRLVIHGKVQRRTGISVANVELFYWQTNEVGKYEYDSKVTDDPEYGYPHGWVKTDKDGRFKIFTARPGAYPGRDIPAHIHIFVKEPDFSDAYYSEDLVFDDDKLLDTKYRQSMQNRGGTGVLRPVKKGDISHADYSMILGLNVPNHPNNVAEKSGLPVGVDSPSFTPFHAYGPDAGKRVCPVCKYGKNVGIIHFSKLPTDDKSIIKWISFYELLSVKHEGKLKVYFVCAGGEMETEQLQQLGESLKVKQIALTVVSSFQDKESEVYLNKISPYVDNTIIIYNNSRIVDKLIDEVPEEQTYAEIKRIIATYFDRSLFKF